MSNSFSRLMDQDIHGIMLRPVNSIVISSLTTMVTAAAAADASLVIFLVSPVTTDSTDSLWALSFLGPWPWDCFQGQSWLALLGPKTSCAKMLVPGLGCKPSLPFVYTLFSLLVQAIKEETSVVLPVPEKPMMNAQGSFDVLLSFAVMFTGQVFRIYFFCFTPTQAKRRKRNTASSLWNSFILFIGEVWGQNSRTQLKWYRFLVSKKFPLSIICALLRRTSRQ